MSEEEVAEYSEKFIVSNIRNLDKDVELRIVSDQKPTPDSIKVETVLEDIYLYFTRNP